MRIAMTPRRSQSLTGRLLVQLTFLGLMVLLLSAVIIGVFTHRAETAALTGRTQLIIESQSASLALALWSLDRRQAQSQVTGIAQADDIAGIAVLEHVRGGKSQPWVVHGDIDPVSQLVFRHQLYAPGEVSAAIESPIGSLEIGFSRRALDAKVWNKVLTTAIGQIVVMACLLALVVLMVRVRITSELRRLASLAREFEPQTGHHGFAALSHRQGGDEIDEVINALEDMRGKLESSYAELDANRMALVRDVEARKLAEERALYAARHDALTDLANRVGLDLALTSMVQQDACGYVLLFDLSDFKLLNDALGHEYGDAVLVSVAQRLRQLAPTPAALARFGGDEFAIAALSSDSEAGMVMARRLHESLSASMSVKSQSITLSISVGISLFPQHGKTAAALLRNADTTLNAAKSKGRGVSMVFEPSLLLGIERRHLLESELRVALASHQVVAHFQAIVDRNGELLGVEALARWQHQSLGWIAPADFIPICEATGKMQELGFAVLRDATRRLAGWRAAGYWPDGAYLAVNVSATQLVDPSFAARVLWELRAQRCNAESIVLEITESALVNEIEVCQRNMQNLRAAGIRLLIDDFGTGYSSLAYLGRLPVNGLKIDRSFVRELGEGTGSEAVIRSVIDIARHFSFSIVAEGVERNDQQKMLELLGVDAFQGYLYSAALAPGTFEQEWLSVAGTPTISRGQSSAT